MSKSQKKKISLRSWIIKETPLKVSKMLSVNPSTVRHWKTGHCLPRAKYQPQIIKLSNGLVSYESMITPHFKKSRTKGNT